MVEKPAMDENPAIVENPVEDLPSSTEIEIPENKRDETKVTPELQSNLPLPDTSLQAQQPITDAAPDQDRVG
jgi:hypothetical protein